MSVFNSDKVEKSLLKKGFVKGNRDHRYFEFLHEGKIVARTHTSHNSQEINNYLIGQMSRQCQLSKEEFLNLVRCPLTQENYIKILKEKDAI